MAKHYPNLNLIKTMDHDLSPFVADVFKYADEIVNRIFNHRPFLQAQIQTMVKEFDDEPINKAYDQPFKRINENIATLKDNSLDLIEQKCDTDCVKLVNQADRLETLMNDIIQSETKNALQRKHQLSEHTGKNNDQLVKFMEQMNLQIDEIDNSYMTAKQDIDKKYAKIYK